MLFQNFITKEIIKSPDDMMVRKTRYILLYILGLLSISFVFMISAMYFSRLFTHNQPTAIEWVYVNGLVWVVVLFVLVTIWIYAISWLIKYFYCVAIINKNSIVKIQFTLFFQEEIQSIELYKVLSIQSKQEGVIQRMLDYWTILMEIQWSGELVFEHMPKPRVLIAKIEEMKAYTTHERFT